MTGASEVASEVNEITGPTSDEPPPPPIPPPQTPWRCVQCAKHETPVKRSGPQGPGTLCNACGLRIRKKSRAVAAAGAAAAAAAAGMPPVRRARHKKRPPPKQKKTQKRKVKDEPPLSKKMRCDANELNKLHRIPISPPALTVSVAVSSSMPAAPIQRVPAANPVLHGLATGILVPTSSAAQPAPAPSGLHKVPSLTASAVAAPTLSAPAPSAAGAIVAPGVVGGVSRTCMTPSISPTQDGAPVSAPTLILGQEALARMTPETPAPPAGAQAIAIAAPEIPFETIVASGALEAPVPPGGLSPSAIPGGPPTTPEGVSVVQAKTPPEAMATLLRQSSQTEDTKPEEMLTAFGMGPVQMEAGSAESANRTEQDGFPDAMLGGIDSSGTGSTQAGVLEALESMDGSDVFPQGTIMVSVEGPYGANGSMAAPADSMGALAGSMVGATSPASMAEQPGFSAPPPGFVPPSEVGRCVSKLTTLGRMNSGITQRVSSIDERILAFARKHEELTVARNEVYFSISQLLGEKTVACNRQRQLCEEIAREKCILQYLEKQQCIAATR